MLPAAIVFDLDYTLWPCWCDTHLQPPVKPVGGHVVDRRGYNLHLYKDVGAILQQLKTQNVKIVAASRTATPQLARQLMLHFSVGSKPMISYFDSLQWGQGSKTRHIAKAAKELGLEQELKEGKFVLYDDERRNRDVKSIGCHFVFIEDTDKGLTKKVFEQGLAEWAAAQS